MDFKFQLRIVYDQAGWDGLGVIVYASKDALIYYYLSLKVTSGSESQGMKDEISM